MEFREELREIAKRTTDTKYERQRKSEENKKKWRETILSVLRPIIEDTDVVLRELKLHTQCGRSNGSGTGVSVDKSSMFGPWEHEIYFVLDAERGKVSCTSSEKEIEERFDRIELITSEVARDKMREFFEIVVRKYV